MGAEPTKKPLSQFSMAIHVYFQKEKLGWWTQTSPNAYELVKNFVVFLLYTRQFFSLNTNYILFLINNAVFENLGFTVHIAFILRGYLVTSSMIYNLEPIKYNGSLLWVGGLFTSIWDLRNYTRTDPTHFNTEEGVFQRLGCIVPGYWGSLWKLTLKEGKH